MVVSPTRELATQIAEVLDAFLREVPRFSRQLVMGGVSSAAQDARRLTEHGANIVVATPGRLHDLLQNRETGARLQTALRTLVSAADAAGPARSAPACPSNSVFL